MAHSARSRARTSSVRVLLCWTIAHDDAELKGYASRNQSKMLGFASPPVFVLDDEQDVRPSACQTLADGPLD